MTDKTETPAPVGFPWVLIIQIIQTVLAIITYLAKRETTPAWKAELERISFGAEKALHTAETQMKRAGE